nr:type II secretion system F family protein [Pelomicrobium methylotrophicum]
MFLSRLAAMLASGVGAGEALKLIRDTFDGRVRDVAHALLLKVESGLTVAEAIEEAGTRAFPEAVSAMIKAGSHSGATWKALRDAMSFEREIRAIRKGSAKGIWSAIGGFAAAAAFIFGTVFWMLPQMMKSDLMKLAGGQENLRWAIEFSYGTGYVMAALAGIAAFFLLLATVGRKIAPVLVDALILRIPVYKDFVLARNNYIAFYAMSMLVATGVRLEQAFSLMAKTTPPGALRNDFARAREAVRRGSPWALAMKTLHPTDRAALASSMDRDQVAKAFSAIADQYRDLYAQRTAAITAILQATAMIFLVLSGLIMFALTILPLLELSSKMTA